MVDLHTEQLKRMRAEWAALKNAAIAKLERQGYEVRGKTTAQIRQILRRHPTRAAPRQPG
ncbi:MAG: hypothetical protein WDN48_11720 [Pseudolabrys sp.]